jgi:hypothetical protein
MRKRLLCVQCEHCVENWSGPSEPQAAIKCSREAKLVTNLVTGREDYNVPLLDCTKQRYPGDADNQAYCGEEGRYWKPSEEARHGPSRNRV